MKNNIGFNYIARDGKTFSMLSEHLQYTKILEGIDSIFKNLPSLPQNEDYDFSGGYGYIQHKKEDIDTAKIMFLKLMRGYIHHKVINDIIVGASNNIRFIDRLFDEYNVPEIGRKWTRFINIDTQYREWGQLYYVTHPDERVNICLNQ